MELIDKAAVVAEIEKLQKRYSECQTRNIYEGGLKEGRLIGYKDALHKLNAIEAKEMDLEKLGEIARHLIAVKDHIEDMRLDKEEWFILENIGYPERFKTQKGE